MKGNDECQKSNVEGMTKIKARNGCKHTATTGRGFVCPQLPRLGVVAYISVGGWSFEGAVLA